MFLMGNKLLVLFLILTLFISGCVRDETKKNADSDSTADNNDISNSVVIIKKRDNTSNANANGGTNTNTNDSVKPNNDTNTNGNSLDTDNLDVDPYATDNYPSISIQADPSNPYVDETFLLTITAEDDNGLKALYWEASDGQTDSFDCSSQKTCSGVWEFTMVNEGAYEVAAYAVDISGHKSGKVSVDVNAQPSRGGGTTSTPSCTDSDGGLAYSTKGTTTDNFGSSTDSCSGNTLFEYYCYENVAYYEDYSCENGCFDGACEAASTPVDDNSCTSNSGCGYKQICSGGECIDVECTSSSQCHGCKKCSGYSCVNCGYGPYGCTC